jgi:SPOR domain
MANNKFPADRERDPIAELAQLIAEADPYGERAAPDNRFRQQTASESHGEAPWLPPAPQLPADLNVPEQAHVLGEYRHDDEAYADDPPYASHEDYQTEVPRVRRRGVALMIAMTGLALLGTAGAFGYREMFGGSVIATPPSIITASNEPNKIAPVSSEPQVKNGNARQDGADTTGSIEKLVSREEQPATIEPPKTATSRAGAPAAPTPATAGQRIPNQVRPRVVAAADPARPPPNAVTSQRAGQSAAAGGTAGANRAHLAAASTAPAEANSAAAVTAPALGSGYVVQVTSERSESGAQAAFRALQAKYPNQLSRRQAMIRRADLGTAGIYYRALVGPFASAEKAAKLCRGLRTAGGDCVILKN